MGNTITGTWAKVMYGVPQGSMLGPLLFLLFINDFPMFMRVKSTPILFAGDTSVLISDSKLSDFKNKIKSIFNNLNECFKNNLVSLNFSKTQFVRFTTRHTNQMEIIIDHDNKTDTLMNNGTNLSLTAACVAFRFRSSRFPHSIAFVQRAIQFAQLFGSSCIELCALRGRGDNCGFCYTMVQHLIRLRVVTGGE